MINPKTYETVGQPLGLAAQDLTSHIGGALTDVHRQVIRDPNLINSARRTYNVAVNKALTEWNNQWKDWADGDLATAYLRGVRHTDFELNQMGISRAADGAISDQTPLAGKGYTLLPPKDVPAHLRGVFSAVPNHLTFYNVFRRAAYHNLEGSTLQVMRASQDLFRDVAVQAGSQMFREADVFTRRALSQSMLNDFAQRGIQSVVYRNGRRVSIEAYSEMVGRTMSGHAAVQASLNRYEEYGYDLVRVSAHFRACELCVPWEGAVLSQSGKSGQYPSLDEAVGAGLWHPNCAHDVSAFFPGLSPKQEVRVSPQEQALIDEHGYRKAQEIAYKAQQQQRYIERNIRNWKMREITALDPAAKAKAHQKVLDWRSAQRTHLTKNQFLPRKYEREAVSGWSQARAAAAPVRPAPFAPAGTIRGAEEWATSSGAFTESVIYSSRDAKFLREGTDGIATANIINQTVYEIKDHYKYGGPLKSVVVKPTGLMPGAKASMAGNHMRWNRKTVVSEMRYGSGHTASGRYATSQKEVIKNITTHEYGHSLHYNIRIAAGRGDQEALALINDWNNLANTIPNREWRRVSEYATYRGNEDVDLRIPELRPEAFADSFLVYHIGKGDLLPSGVKALFDKLVIR